MQLYGKVKDLLSRLGEAPENFTGRILFMSMFNDISCGTKDNEKECVANAKVVSLYAKKFGIGQWSFLGPGSEMKWYLWKRTVHKEFGTISQKRCCWNSPKAHVQFSVLRPHCLRGQLRSKGHGKLSIHFAATQATIETVFRIIVSANQLSLYGAVASMCEEYESRHDRSGRPDKVMGQSIVLSEIKTEVPLENDDPAYQNFYCSNMKNELRGFHNKIK